VEASGEIHGGRSVCEVDRGPDGRIRIVEHFTRNTRSGSGTNVFEEMDALRLNTVGQALPCLWRPTTLQAVHHTEVRAKYPQIMRNLASILLLLPQLESAAIARPRIPGFLLA
jgi:hypothetical protein